ncbi:hypothetical protein ACIGG9_24785 [Pseudonocardia alni]|uniref:hypothetical protein n=1 Tax=Pseudonocardia alni TaxID=33907 RepID=UPI0033F2F229
MPLDRLTAQYAADLSWARTRDRAARTAPARRGLDARFEREARELMGDGATDKQIAQSAESLRRAHFRKLSRRSAQVRSRRAA